MVRFDIIWKTPLNVETVLATVTHTFPIGAGVKFDADLNGIAAPANRGDKLILRFSTVGGATGATYTPNGDGSAVGARIPSLKLPQ